MPGTRIQEALGEVQPGPLLQDVHFMGLGVVKRGIREAVVPEGSPLADPKITTLIASNGNTNERGIDAAVALEIGEDDQETAEMTIDPREPLFKDNPRYLGRFLQAVSQRFKLKEISIDPGTSTGTIDPDMLIKAGFTKKSDNKAVYTNPDRVRGVSIFEPRVA